MGAPGGFISCVECTDLDILDHGSTYLEVGYGHVFDEDVLGMTAVDGAYHYCMRRSTLGPCLCSS